MLLQATGLCRPSPFGRAEPPSPPRPHPHGWLPPLVGEATVLLAAAGATSAIRRAVDAGRLQDGASLAVMSLFALALAAAGAFALRHAATRRTWRHRARRALLPVGLLTIALAFVAASVVDLSVETEAMLAADGPPSAPAILVVGPGGQDVRLVGEIGEGLARRLANLLAAHPHVTRIHLTSEGGLADEGQNLGDVIAAHHLTTFVPDYCVSACTLAFVRGTERLMLDDARLGFHAPYEPGLFGAMYKGDSSEQRAAYLAAGLDPAFVAAALKVEPADIWFPKTRRLLDARVITATVDRHHLPDSNLDGAATLDGARALILHNFPLVRVFLDRSPRAIDAIAGWYLDSYLSARPEGENTDALRLVVRSAVAAGLARADDAALLDIAAFLDRALANTADAGACARIAGHADLTEATRQLEAADRNADVEARALFGRALDGHHVLAATAPRLLTVATRNEGSPTPLSCPQWRQRLAAMLNRDQPGASTPLRALIDAQGLQSLVALRSVARPQPRTAVADAGR